VIKETSGTDAVAKEIDGDKHHFRFVSVAVQLGNDRSAPLGTQSVDEKGMTIMDAAEEFEHHR